MTVNWYRTDRRELAGIQGVWIENVTEKYVLTLTQASDNGSEIVRQTPSILATLDYKLSTSQQVIVVITGARLSSTRLVYSLHPMGTLRSTPPSLIAAQMLTIMLSMI